VCVSLYEPTPVLAYAYLSSYANAYLHMYVHIIYPYLHTYIPLLFVCPRPWASWRLCWRYFRSLPCVRSPPPRARPDQCWCSSGRARPSWWVGDIYVYVCVCVCMYVCMYVIYGNVYSDVLLYLHDIVCS
jgi:hypothetical protein